MLLVAVMLQKEKMPEKAARPETFSPREAFLQKYYFASRKKTLALKVARYRKEENESARIFGLQPVLFETAEKAQNLTLRSSSASRTAS